MHSKRNPIHKNRAYTAFFKDDRGFSYSLQLTVGAKVREPSPADVVPLVIKYLSALGRTLSGGVKVGDATGAKRMRE